MGVYLMVRLVDKVNTDDARLNAMCGKRGDVADIIDDAEPLTTELHPDNQDAPWMPVHVDAKAEDLSAFLALDLPDTARPAKMQRRRAFAFDIDAYLRDSKPTLTRREALTFKVRKPELLHPYIFA